MCKIHKISKKKKQFKDKKTIKNDRRHKQAFSFPDNSSDLKKKEIKM